MDEAPVKIFVKGVNRWRDEQEWPLKRTQWVKLYLRENGRLDAMAPAPHERPDSFINEPWRASTRRALCVTCATAPMEKDTSTPGCALYLHADLSGTEANWMALITMSRPTERRRWSPRAGSGFAPRARSRKNEARRYPIIRTRARFRSSPAK
jgi:hypothetical protein